jgi:DNA processing protein
MLSHDELGAWLRLATTPGIGRATARQLLASFGSAERVLAADADALLAVAGPAVVELLTRHDRRDAEALAATRRWLDNAEADAPRDIVVLGDPRYPALLLETADPPLLLFTLGRVALLSAPGVAIVGSRSATPQGMDNARTFARFLSQRGLAVVSGLAMGIDGAAHEGALAAPGATVAFIGTGIDRVYPARHAALARRIAEHGLVASEYPLGAEPLAAHFPRRNRLIAGITLGTLVVEAAVESGSLITARMAAEAGREVFAIPGSIHSPQSRGCHRLIQEGAKLVETGDDVLRELRLEPVAARHAAAGPSPFAAMTDEVRATAPTDALLDALGYDPVTPDVLAARTGLPAEQLAAQLLELELAGAVQRMPGGLLQRRASA